MENIPVVKVKLVSRESVKPLIPTPSHRRNFNLCYVDQILPLVPPFLTSGLVFYTSTPKTQPLDIHRLKTCLSKTLSSFYPLAGSIKQSTINCNDEGIPFIVTQVNCPLSHVLNSPQILDLVTKFLPPRDSLGIVSGDDEDLPIIVDKLVHLAIQISVFTCGGVAIGWYDIHKVMDGTSSATFFKHWAALTRQQSYEGLIKPDFDAAIAAFPPSPKPQLLGLGNSCKNHVQNSPTVVKSFIFRNSSITKLKGRAASEHVPNPTRYQALAGFIWEQLLIVTHSKVDEECKNTDTILQITVDIRPFINPPLPRGSIGNLVDTAIALSENLAALPELVAEIHAAVSKKKGQINKKYHGEKGVEAVRESWDNLITTVTEYKERAFKVVSWCNLGFNDLDFGFGKPKWMVPTDGIMSSFHRNLIILTDFHDSNGDGVEAWFFLEEKDIRVLVSNPDFLAFASPS